jgi:peptide/nickel transport system permease protein
LAALIGVCTPAFVWGVIFQLVFAFFIPLFPLEGRLSEGFGRPPPVTGFLTIDALLAGNPAMFADAVHHLALPALALAMAGIGQTARLTRANMIEVYDRPYIEMAQAAGFSPWRIATRYAFRPAFIPTLTVLGLDFAALLGNAFLVERVFVWPGISRYGVEVILRKDLDAIVGTVLIVAAAFLIVNIVVDLLVTLVNPRIRLAARRP